MKKNNFIISPTFLGTVAGIILFTAPFAGISTDTSSPGNNAAGLEQNIKVLTITTVGDKEIKKLDDENNSLKQKVEENQKLAAAQVDDTREVYNALARSYQRLISLNESKKKVWQSIVDLSK